MKKEEVIEAITKIIRRYLPDNYKILLFGSFAKGDALETSDIDIAILGKEKVSLSIMSKILSEKEEIPTLRSIDVVDLNAKGENFKNSVLKYAQLLS